MLEFNRLKNERDREEKEGLSGQKTLKETGSKAEERESRLRRLEAELAELAAEKSKNTEDNGDVAEEGQKEKAIDEIANEKEHTVQEKSKALEEREKLDLQKHDSAAGEAAEHKIGSADALEVDSHKYDDFDIDKASSSPPEQESPRTDGLRRRDLGDPARWSSANATICAPQLLHLDRDGRPLWFNGWILDNKFTDSNTAKVKDLSKFDVFMAEKLTDGSTGDWTLEQNNMCCLQGSREDVQQFTKGEREVLDMILGVAKEVGAVK